MPTAILKRRAHPFHVAAGIEQIAIGQNAVDEEGFFGHESDFFKLLAFIFGHV
jgi:hypothetical protein